jgi:hypothetical protein
MKTNPFVLFLVSYISSYGQNMSSKPLISWGDFPYQNHSRCTMPKSGEQIHWMKVISKKFLINRLKDVIACMSLGLQLRIFDAIKTWITFLCIFLFEILVLSVWSKYYWKSEKTNFCISVKGDTFDQYLWTSLL